MSSQTTKMQFCVSCGEKLPALAGFCVHCGQAVPMLNAQTADPAAVSPSPPLEVPPRALKETPLDPLREAPQRMPSGVAPRAESPLLPPVALAKSAPPVGLKVSPPAPATGKARSWLLSVVGVCLLAVLFGAGYRLLKGGGESAAGAASGVATLSAVADSTATSPKPTTVASSEASQPEIPPAQPITRPVTKESFDTANIPGIESIALDDPSSYLPYINTRYRSSINFPDGDKGRMETVVAAAGNSGVVTAIDLIFSERFPNDPPALWITHYAVRADGIYRSSDEDPGQADLYLPANLALGKRWKSAVGSFEVTHFDSEITVGGTDFTGVLAFRTINPEVELDQTTWVAPGFGTVLVRSGAAGGEVSRYLSSELLDPQQIEALVKKHVVNAGKVR